MSTKAIETIVGGVTAATGFLAAGVEAHVKYAKRKDFALVVSETPALVAGMFTTNEIAAAPVRYDRKIIARAKPVRAVAVNTGCANACTGEKGDAAAAEMAAMTEAALGVGKGSVLVGSTGVIGRQLPMNAIARGIKGAVKALESTPEAAHNASLAILTTDTKPKEAAVEFTVGKKTVRVGGMCKGSGMIEPLMATMIAIITTDADVSQEDLNEALRVAVGSSFNRIVIDNDRSTNDTALLLANGASGAKPPKKLFIEAVKAVCVNLAKQMVLDGEGVSKFVALRVVGARNAQEAEMAARAIARSMLVKTSWYGRDANWGRVIAAAGYSGAKVVERKAVVQYAGIKAFDCGEVATDKTLEKICEAMKAREFEVLVDLGTGGKGSAQLMTADLTHEYVNINAEYTT